MKRRTHFGFTLVELVIAIAVLLGISSIGSAAYVNFNERQALQQAALTLKNNLRFAQSKAMAGETDPTVCNLQPTKLFGWCVTANPNPNNIEYELYGTCGDDTASPATVYPFPVVGSENQIITKFPSKVIMTIGSLDPSDTWLAPGAPGVAQTILFRPQGKGALIIYTPPLPATSVVHKEIGYCLEGSYPSLASNNKYVIRVRSSGEIIDDGFKSTCPW